MANSKVSIKSGRQASPDGAKSELQEASIRRVLGLSDRGYRHGSFCYPIFRATNNLEFGPRIMPFEFDVETLRAQLEISDCEFGHPFGKCGINVKHVIWCIWLKTDYGLKKRSYDYRIRPSRLKPSARANNDLSPLRA